MRSRSPLASCVFAAVMLSIALSSCTDGPITSAIRPTQDPFGSVQGLDSVLPLPPGDSVTVGFCRTESNSYALCRHRTIMISSAFRNSLSE